MADLIFEQIYYDAFLSGQRRGAELAGTELPDPLPPDVEQSLRKQARRQAAQLEEMVIDSPESRSRVAEMVNEWMAADGPVSLTDLARALEPEFGLTRALTIARTETAQAYEAANAAQIQAAGFPAIEWSAALDACPLCLELDGKIMSPEDYQTYRADAHPNCLIAGTLITCKYGNKEIQDIAIGDEVLTHLGRWRKVVAIHRREYTGLIYTVSFAIGGWVVATDEHPFGTARGWVAARDLIPAGDLVRCWRPDPDGWMGLFETAICQVASGFADRLWVYNFAVAEDESYIANGAVVHNCSCFGIPSDALPGSDYALENPFPATDFDRDAPEAAEE